MRLSRDVTGPAPPVRMVHLGPGAFFRSHTAWCTDRAGDGWGIAAVGRTPASVADLAAQGGAYSLLTRHPDRDEVTVHGAIAATATLDDLGGLLADPAVAVVTLTVTESAYTPTSPVVAALARALARRNGAPIAVVACDNLPDGGERLAAACRELEPSLGDAACAFASSVVDRITPAATDADRAAVAAATGWRDAAAAVAEPAFEWVITDRFPAGRPAWHTAGATVVDDVAPWAERKLRMLNAAHSLLAYAGGARGHAHVHEAAADPALRPAVEALWQAQRPAMAPAAAALADRAYLDGLWARWANARLPHRLAQIAADGSAKLAVRVAPTLRRRPDPAAAAVVGAWVAHLRGATAFPPVDAALAALGPVRSLPLADACRHALTVLDRSGLDRSGLDRSRLDAGLGDDPGTVAAVTEAAAAYLSR